MYSDNKNILETVALLVAHGITDVVVCPGSRNAALVHTLAQTKALQCHAVTDERSAGFQAIGIALATGRPTAVCVTSGSALVNLHPAVAEAYYQQVPLIVISADRPQAWIGQMDGQTMPQPDVFGLMSKKSVTLPEIHTNEDKWYANRLINEALLACTHRGRGPVHINIPVSEPFYEFHTPELPIVRKIERLEGLTPENSRKIANLLDSCSKRMIIIGQKTPDKKLHQIFVQEMQKGFIALTENLANMGTGADVLTNPEAIISAIPEDNVEAYRPELVITLGGHIVSKKLKNFLRKNPPRMHWHVSPDGTLVDTFGTLTHVIEAYPYAFIEHLAYLMLKFEEDGAYGQLWHATTPQPAEKDDVWDKLFRQLPSNAILHLANSSTIRKAQQYPLPPTVTVCCNRGINGIEGSMSTAVGYASATPERPNFLIIGDLSFFYDQNALWKTSFPKNLHILLINNGGGAIFDTLPLPDDDDSRRMITAQHHTTAENVAAQYGLRYLRGEQHLQEFMDSKETLILELL